MQAMTKSFQTGGPSVPSTAEGEELGPGLGLSPGVEAIAEDDDEDEADIELLKMGGVGVARLRHPAGAEALVDLRVGLVYGWLARPAVEFTLAGPPNAVAIAAGWPPGGAPLAPCHARRLEQRAVCDSDLRRRPLALARGADHRRLPEHRSRDDRRREPFCGRGAMRAVPAELRGGPGREAPLRAASGGEVDELALHALRGEGGPLAASVPPGGRWTTHAAWEASLASQA